MSAWGGVYVGDTVRGADQRPWAVEGVRRGATWLGDGRTDVHLDLRLDERHVTARRSMTDPCEVVSRADHSDLADACAALLAAGLTPTIVEDRLTAVDQFTPPAAAAQPRLDRWNRYVLPDPETGKERAWTRATTVARTLADEYHLTLWKMRMVARGMALRPDLVAGAAAADPDEDKGTLNKIADQAMERAGSGAGANLGTALHAFTARLDREGGYIQSLEAPEALHADLAAYGDTLRRHRLKVHREHVERLVVVPELGVAGTLDRLVRQPPGQTKAKPFAVLDLKTAKPDDSGGLSNFAFLEIAIQLAIYAHAPLMWDAGKRAYEPMPADVDTDRALVLHLPVGKAHGALYGVNLIEGWRYAQLAMSVREARSGAKGLCWMVEPEPADLALHRVSRAADRAELARLWDQLHPQGLWSEEVNAAAAARLNEIQSAPA
jgi:hypothetical protein